jgi:uncharacterized membrane protein YhaH (DUF805 family)
MQWMLMPLRRYADFSGRSRRKEYWMFILGYFLLYAVLGIVFFAGGDFSGYDPAMGMTGLPLALVMVFGVVTLALIIPSIAVQVRRFHDQDKSGWLVLLSFIPYIGGIIVIVFMCLPGTVGPNRFGPDPKNPFDTDVFA